MENVEIRLAAGARGLRLWEVAEELGMTDSAFSRKLRRELPDDQREKVLEAIERASARKAVQP